MNRLAGRRAIVAGGAKGIGAAIARAYVSEGADTVIFDVEGPRATATAEAIGEGCRAIQVDVSSEAAVDEAFGRLEADGFACGLLVNNAASA